MPTYTCPECDTKMKRKEPVAAGKKLRCPECQAVFPVKGEKVAAKPAPAPAPAAPPRNKWDDEDDGPANYGVVADVVDKASEERKAQAFSALKDRFDRSARGPALEIVVKPSNYLLLCGVLTCCMALGGAFWSVFPMIFKVEKVNNEKKTIFDYGKTEKKVYEQLTPEEQTTRFYCLGGFVVFFLWGAIVCAGASKIHEIEKYWLCWIGTVLALVGPFVPLGIWLLTQGLYDEKGNSLPEPDMAFIGPAIICFIVPGIPVSIWNMSVLSKQAVKDGFAEEPVL